MGRWGWYKFYTLVIPTLCEPLENVLRNKMNMENLCFYLSHSVSFSELKWNHIVLLAPFVNASIVRYLLCNFHGKKITVSKLKTATATATVVAAAEPTTTNSSNNKNNSKKNSIPSKMSYFVVGSGVIDRFILPNYILIVLHISIVHNVR